MNTRQAVRGLLVTEDQSKLLLLKIRSPVNNRTMWMTPGGGKEAGETDEQALKREIWEETGQNIVECGQLVFERHFSYQSKNGPFSQFEKYFLLFLKEFTPTMQNNPAESEVNIFLDYHWWHIDQISASSETFAPSRLGLHLISILNPSSEYQTRLPVSIN